jgi:hypothetical protein
MLFFDIINLLPYEPTIQPDDIGSRVPNNMFIIMVTPPVEELLSAIVRMVEFNRIHMIGNVTKDIKVFIKQILGNFITYHHILVTLE